MFFNRCPSCFIHSWCASLPTAHCRFNSTNRIFQFLLRRLYRKLGVHFDGIYTGFLANEAQVAEILEFIHCFRKPGTLLLVDPVMGDHGKIYSTYTPALCERMAHLVSLADAITPNLTEACILANVDYEELISHQKEYHEAPDFYESLKSERMSSDPKNTRQRFFLNDP